MTFPCKMSVVFINEIKKSSNTLFHEEFQRYSGCHVRADAQTDMERIIGTFIQLFTDNSHTQFCSNYSSSGSMQYKFCLRRITSEIKSCLGHLCTFH